MNAQIEVYQTRSLDPFYDRENDEILDEEMFREIRNVDMLDADEIDHETFGRLYQLVGTDEIDADDEPHALSCVFARWNNGSGVESEAFRESNDQRRAVSLSVGDIVRVNGTAFRVDRFGFSKIEAISY